MKMTVKTLVFHLLLWGAPAWLWAQTSLWRDHNPYSDPLAAGQLVEISVDEMFSVSAETGTEKSSKQEIRLMPDKTALEFLQPSEQSKNRAVGNKGRYKVKDRIVFQIMGQIVPQNAGLIAVTARKQIMLDKMPVVIDLNGQTSGRYIQNGRLQSRHIANLQLTLEFEVPEPRDNSIKLKPPAQGEIKDPNNPSPNEAKLSDQEKENIKLRYLQEIVGALNQ